MRTGPAHTWAGPVSFAEFIAVGFYLFEASALKLW